MLVYSYKNTKSKGPKKFDEMLRNDSNAVLIDLRTEEEYALGHLEGALLIDFLQGESFDQQIDSLDKTKNYYIYCRSGGRSHTAAVKMRRIGLQVIDMKGGYMAWTTEGLPVTR